MKHRYGIGACVAAATFALFAPSVVAETIPAASSPAQAPAAQLPAPPASGEMGFVFSLFIPAVVDANMKDVCPDGTSNMVKDNYLSTLPAAERARLSLPANEPELTQKWKAYGVDFAGHKNVCTNYDQYNDHPLYKLLNSKIAYGVNLDNGKTNDPYLCSHEQFTSPSGEKSIDNQAYRAMGCDRQFRGPDGKIGDILPGYKGWLATGEYTIVMILRNVHSLENDDNVEILLASSPDKPIVDTQQNFIRDASYQVTPNPRWRATLHGHITNGVLTTDSQDIVFARPIGLGGMRGLKSEWDFGRGRLRVTFKPDGTFDGVLGGYVPLITFMPHQIFGGVGTVVVADIDCASEYRTMKTLADGDRDPKTGQCNRISTAMKVEAVPAFVFDKSNATKAAAAN